MDAAFERECQPKPVDNPGGLGKVLAACRGNVTPDEHRLHCLSVASEPIGPARRISDKKANKQCGRQAVAAKLPSRSRIRER